MSDVLPSYEDCQAALAMLAPAVLGIVPHVSGTGIQGDEREPYRVVVYVDRGTKESLLAAGKIPSAIQVGSGRAVVTVPVVLEEQDAPAFQ